MSTVAMRVKCKGCAAHVLTSPNDPPRTVSDGTPVNAATCGKCGAVTLYKKPTPKPAEERSPLADLDFAERPALRESREVRLPAIVLKAAWWVRLTLLIFWTNVIICITVYFVGAAVTLYLESQRTRSSR